MQRRVAMSVSVAATASLAVGTVAFGAVGGASIFGFNDSIGPVAHRSAVIVKHRTETIDQVVVVSSPATITASADGADSTVILAAPVDSGAPAPKTNSPNSSAQTVTTVSRKSSPAATVAPNPAVQKAQTATSAVGANSSSTQSTSAAAETTPPSSTSSVVAETAPTTTAAPVTTAAPETTVATTVATTVPAPATTVRPSGVPADWPANRPIPPMPPGCQKPQLEDNGVWNCEH